MRINIDWLRDWVDITATPVELAESLTLAGLEVDSVEAVAAGIDGIRVAEVLAVEAHPNADRLRVCRVDSGDAELSIVCGAPNVAAGIKVPFAPVGSILPGGREIKAATIRGVGSDGMLCSAAELGLAQDAAGLLVLDSTAPVGGALTDYLRLDDAVLDIDLTPNRGDCFSVLGIAREIAAGGDKLLSGPVIEAAPVGSSATFPVTLADGAACPRFAGRVIRGLTAAARSPDWLRERLRRAGLRPIHPVVDVTNYVMLELGQPLHAYRLDRLEQGIVVRFAAAGEKLVLLDGSEVELEPDVLTIADASGPIGLAGIMGGASTAVDAQTLDIFLESAFFTPDALQGRARRYGMHTDASVRFERGVDPAGQERAIERATALLQSIAGGEAGPLQLVEDAAHQPASRRIALRHAKVEARLGISIGPDAVVRLLERLGMTVHSDADSWTVRPPTHRFDLAIEEDLIEEIGRLYGYDNIPTVPGTATVRLGSVTEQRVSVERIGDVLTDRGYSEAIGYGFIDEAAERAMNPDSVPVRLANPISSELSVMRGSLWPGLLRTAQLNISRQQDRCRLFEIGTEFRSAAGQVVETTVVAGLAVGPVEPEHWDQASREVDFYDVKADVEALLGLTHKETQFAFLAARHPALNPARAARIDADGAEVGWLGELHPRLLREFDLKHAPIVFSLAVDAAFAARLPKFETYSKFPRVRRDLAVVVDEGVAVGDISRLAKLTLGERLQQLVVFDLYRGKGIESGRKSIGLGLILQDASRTLTDDDADAMTEQVMRRLEHELGARIRT